MLSKRTYNYPHFMTSSIRDNKKSRGRPKTTGTGTLIGIRLHEPELEEIDEWRRRQEDIPSRPEALRRLYKQGLVAETVQNGRRSKRQRS